MRIEALLREPGEGAHAGDVDATFSARYSSVLENEAGSPN